MILAPSEGQVPAPGDIEKNVYFSTTEVDVKVTHTDFHWHRYH